MHGHTKFSLVYACMTIVIILYELQIHLILLYVFKILFSLYAVTYYVIITKST